MTDDGTLQSPRNGVYRSASGKRGSFEKLDADRLRAAGRTSVGWSSGHAVGPHQDHDVLYALVQDAKLLNNGGVVGIDAPEGEKPPVPSRSAHGAQRPLRLHRLRRAGRSWRRGTELAADPTTGSALVGTGTATGYQPGVQGWYNLWVQPDPTRRPRRASPTRLVFGLEEIWSNEATPTGARPAP